MRITVPTTVINGDHWPDLPKSIGWSDPEYSADYQTVTVTLPDTPEVEQWAVEQGYIVTTPRIAQRKATQLAVADKIIADALDDQTVAELSALFDPWEPDQAVKVGDLRSWDDTVVECIQAHTTQADWTPDVVPALWKIHRTPVDGPEVWQANASYSTGERVWYPDLDGTEYACLQGHTSQAGWEPPNAPALWEVHQP